MDALRRAATAVAVLGALMTWPVSAEFGAADIGCDQHPEVYRERLEPVVQNFEVAAEACANLYMTMSYTFADRSAACRNTWKMWLSDNSLEFAQVEHLAEQGCFWNREDHSEDCYLAYVEAAGLTDLFARYKKALQRYEAAKDTAWDIHSAELDRQLQESAHRREAAQALLDKEQGKAFKIIQRFLYIDETGVGSLEMARAVQSWNRSHGIGHDGISLALLMEAMERFPPESIEIPEQERASDWGPYPPAGRDMDKHEVLAVQRMLGITADGQIGPQTMAAVKAWNRANGIGHDYITEHMIELALDL